MCLQSTQRFARLETSPPLPKQNTGNKELQGVLCQPLQNLLLFTFYDTVYLQGAFLRIKKRSKQASFWEVKPTRNKKPKRGQRYKEGRKLNPHKFSRRQKKVVVTPFFDFAGNVGLDCEIHNGKRFVPFKVREEMVGHKFGEFALTRKRPQHKSSKKKRR